ncbi:DUF1289 domain-containing protein [Diaphorobacter sp. HDW4A]|uniref:DUF1289 domain-containing protein n=1 Tax=Diaphorobacter sp. HDW4A TaxID=2714924 RepID=UPI001408D898|nr:DUF1289 domain-containing protein [Diaphorobacter sp. HDW4A]QIL83280.1 DUF1289 domain-containing protein [Diaphorobacter sp. HDW4A]
MSDIVDNLLLEARAQDVAAIGHFSEAYDGIVDSPCVNVCRMTADRSHCQGCFRTIDEIRQWSKADAATRRTIWFAALERADIEQPKAIA